MSAPPSNRWFHIPMEIVDRELYPKLLLSSKLIKEGWSCVIGTKRTVLDAAEQIPPGLVYLKSVIPSEYNNMMHYKSCGHRLVCLDEEGLIQSSLNTLVNARYCEETVKEAEKFYCWGDIARNALQNRYPEYAEKFMTTGSPTADLWSHKSKAIHQKSVDKIHERFGKYILIPSSFATPNHFMGKNASIKIMQRDNMFKTKAEEEYYQNYHDYVEKVMNAFINLFPILSKEFPEHTIILRPHPSDNQETWHKFTQGLDNVKVVFEGPVSPWLHGAEAILHWGSTTGLEAYLLGKPVIGHTPYPEEEKRYDVLPHLVSAMTHTPKDAIEALKYVIKNPEHWTEHFPAVQAGHEELKKWMHNLEHDSAVDYLVRDFETFDIQPYSKEDYFKFVENKQTNFKELVWFVLEQIGRIEFIKNMYPEHFKIGVNSRAYGRHKTQSLSLSSVKDALQQLGHEDFKVTEVQKELFIIQS